MTRNKCYNNFVMSLLLFLFNKVATGNPFVLKRGGENSRTFMTSPDILVVKGKNSVTNATLLVTISSPVAVF